MSEEHQFYERKGELPERLRIAAILVRKQRPGSVSGRHWTDDIAADIEAARAQIMNAPISYDALVAFCRQVHSALDDALGDTDISHVESDEELREDHPVQWAAMTLAHAITLAHGWDSDDQQG